MSQAGPEPFVTQDDNSAVSLARKLISLMTFCHECARGTQLLLPDGSSCARNKVDLTGAGGCLRSAMEARFRAVVDAPANLSERPFLAEVECSSASWRLSACNLGCAIRRRKLAINDVLLDAALFAGET